MWSDKQKRKESHSPEESYPGLYLKFFFNILQFVVVHLPTKMPKAGTVAKVLAKINLASLSR